MDQREQGQLIQADFFDNLAGLNITDSPFFVKDGQATGGYNYDYALSGGFRKRDGHSRLNSSADAQLKSIGIGVRIDNSNTKTVLRGAGTKLQKFDDSAYTFTNLTEDTTTAGSDFLDSNSTQALVFTHFNTAAKQVLWAAGAGQAAGTLIGAYSATKVTKNGSFPPTGAISLSAGGSGGTIPTGTYYYSVALQKASTGAISNAALDQSVSVTLGDKVTVTLTGLTSLDTTKYDKIVIYRSSAGGVSGFTAGVQVATVASTSSSYVDDGTIEVAAASVPRANSLVLDNSTLDQSKTYSVVATFQNRMVVASGNTLYYSELGASEAWPTANFLSIPSGGPITALAILSFNTPTTSSFDEVLAVFKERELWAVRLDANGDPEVKFIDSVGCPSQSLVVSANGYLAWMDYRGIYLWDGSGKAIYCSRPIEKFFSKTGDLDKTKLTQGFVKFFRRTNQIVWTISHVTIGANKVQIKLDLRFTLPRVEEALAARMMDGVFVFDKLPFSIYAGDTYLPAGTLEEAFLAGDDAGYMYSLFNGLADGVTSSLDFSYETKFMDFGAKTTAKRYHKVIVWTEESTDQNLTLDWWTSYKSGEDDKATMSLPASNAVSEASWDLAYWDSAFWDSTVRSYSPIVFNLSSPKGATEGDCLKLRFRQADGNAPITIAGFTVIYSVMGLRK